MNRLGKHIDNIDDHLSKQISQIYDILISLTQRVEKIETHLCAKCAEDKANARN